MVIWSTLACLLVELNPNITGTSLTTCNCWGMLRRLLNVKSPNTLGGFGARSPKGLDPSTRLHSPTLMIEIYIYICIDRIITRSKELILSNEQWQRKTIRFDDGSRKHHSEGTVKKVLSTIDHQFLDLPPETWDTSQNFDVSQLPAVYFVIN